jgi:hypothetical protein
MVAACLASNVPVWIATTQPRNLSGAGRTNLINVKEWIISTFPDRYLDFWTTIANANGTINATYNSGDGVHLNNAGHQVLYNRVVASRLYELISASIGFYPTVKINGLIGDTYRVDYATALAPTTWIPLNTNVLVTSPQLVVDATSPGDNSRFYRAVYLP